MNQAAAAAQKAFFVGIQNRHQRHLGDVQAFTQQVNPHQHIKQAQAQIADDFHAFDGVDVAVQIAHFDAQIIVIIGELLGHAFGQRGHQHTLADGGALGDFAHQVVDLRANGANF